MRAGDCGADGACVCDQGAAGAACEEASPGVTAFTGRSLVRSTTLVDQLGGAKAAVWSDTHQVLYAGFADGLVGAYSVEAAADVTAAADPGLEEVTSATPWSSLVPADGLPAGALVSQQRPSAENSDSAPNAHVLAYHSVVETPDGSALYIGINMYDPAASRYSYRIVKMYKSGVGSLHLLAGGSSSGQYGVSRMAKIEEQDYYLDAMAVDRAGDVIFKLSKLTGDTLDSATSLTHVMRTGSHLQSYDGGDGDDKDIDITSEDLLTLQYYFECAVSGQISNKNFVFFAGQKYRFTGGSGASNLEAAVARWYEGTLDTSAAVEFKPAFSKSWGVGYASSERTCGASSDTQKSITFSTMVAYQTAGVLQLYLGTTSSERTAPGCILKIEVDGSGNMAHIGTVILNPERGERDLRSGTVDYSSNALFMVTSDPDEQSRLIKVDLTTFAPAGSFAASGGLSPLGAVALPVLDTSVPADGLNDVHGVVVLSSGTVSTLRRLGTPQVTGLDPKYGPSTVDALGGTPVTVSGRGFYEPAGGDPVRCKFGSAGATDGTWQAADSTVLCVAPGAASTGAANNRAGHAPVKLSFDGGLTYTDDEVYFLYYDTPAVTAVSPAALARTGLDSLSVGVELQVLGGPFFDAADAAGNSLLRVRFSNATAETLVEATYVSPTEITCLSPSFDTAGAREIAVSLNARTENYHASSAGAALSAYGLPHALRAASTGAQYAYRCCSPVPANLDEATVQLDAITVQVVAADGTLVPEASGLINRVQMVVAQPSAAGGSPMDMALVGDTLVKTTTNGEATFTLALEGAPLMGTYTIGFEPGALGESSQWLSASPGLALEATSVDIVILPGDAYALEIEPVEASVEAAASVTLGFFSVRVVDLAGNPLDTLDVDPRAIESTLSRGTSYVGDAAGDWEGGQFGGQTVRDMASGQVQFEDLAIGVIRASDSAYYTAGAYTLRFGDQSGVLRGSSVAISVAAGPPTFFEVSARGGERNIEQVTNRGLPPVTLQAFDAGNNLAVIAGTYAISASCNTLSFADGSVTTIALASDASVQFDALRVATPAAAGRHNVSFQSAGFAPILVEFSIPLGGADYLDVVAPSSGGAVGVRTYRSEQQVLLDAFEVLVRDVGGNALRAADTATRTVRLTASAGLQLGGVSNPRMTEGALLVDGLYAVAPKAGTYTVSVASPGLSATLFEIEIRVGDAVALMVTGTPQLLYTADALVDLDDIEVALVDAGQNVVPTMDPFTYFFDEEVDTSDANSTWLPLADPCTDATGCQAEYEQEATSVLTEIASASGEWAESMEIGTFVETMWRSMVTTRTFNSTHQRYRDQERIYNRTEVTTASYVVRAYGEASSGGFEPYLTGLDRLSLGYGTNLPIEGGLALDLDRNGTDMRLLQSGEGVTTFTGLQLRRPDAGEATLYFDTKKAGIAPTNLTVVIETGAPHHLGIPFFVAYSFASVAPTAVGGYAPEFIAESCAGTLTNCERDKRLRVHVLDAAENFVGELDEESRELRLTLLGTSALLVRCTRYAQGACTQTADAGEYLDTDAREGVAEFDSAAIMAPDGVYGPLVGTYVLEIVADGLGGVRYPIEVVTGPAARLLVIPPDVLAYQSSKNMRLKTIILNVLDSGGNPLRGCCARGEDCCDNDRVISVGVRDDTAAIRSGDLRGANATLATDGVGDFVGAYRGVYLSAPLVGEHEMVFTSDGLDEASFVLSVSAGEATRLGIASPPLDALGRVLTPYSALPDLPLGEVVIRAFDHAGNHATSSRATVIRVVNGTAAEYSDRPMRHELSCGTCYDRTLDRPMGPPSTLPGETTFSELSLLTPEACNTAYDDPGAYARPYCYSLTFVDVAGLLQPATILLQVNIGAPYRLHINHTFQPQDANEEDPPYVLETEERSRATVQLRAIPVLVYDGGDNYLGDLDVDEFGQTMERVIQISRVGKPGLATADPSTLLPLRTCPAYADFDITQARGILSPDRSPYTSGALEDGHHLFRQIRIASPPSGAYSLRFEELVPEPEEEGEEMREPLLPFDLPITILPGYPTRLEVEELDMHLEREIASADRVKLPDIAVSLFDAGDNFMSQYALDTEANDGLPYAAERRNVSMRVTHFVDLDGGVTTFRANESILFDDGATIEDHGMARVYQGVATFTELYLFKPLAGTYHFLVESVCDFEFCPASPSAAGRTLAPTDALVLTVVPGEPVALTWATPPPQVIENIFEFANLPVLDMRDAAGNLCTQQDTFVTVRFSPPVLELRGHVGPVIAGVGSLQSLRVVGNRGSDYSLTFEVPVMDLELSYGPVRVLSCEDVKPNSVPDASGGCICVPGYTEDINGKDATGYTVGYNSTAVFFDLYSNVVHEKGGWVDALQPYGVCAPCKDGSYKPEPGAHACTACPPNMDTRFVDGRLARTRVSASGELLAGELGHVAKTSCHCVVEPWLSVDMPGESFYQDTDDRYLCHPCPYGGICDGLGIAQIEAGPGHWRTSRSSIVFERCPNPDSCLGGVESECLDGNGTAHTGVLCASCAADHAYPSAPSAVPLIADMANSLFCNKCLPLWANGVLVALSLIAKAGVIVAVYLAATRTDSSTIMHYKTMLNYLQTVSNPNDIALRWPTAVSAYFVFARQLGTVSLQSNAADCLLGLDHYGWTGIYISIPVVLVVGALVYHQFISTRQRLRKAREAQRLKYLEEEDQAGADAEAGALASGESGDFASGAGGDSSPARDAESAAAALKEGRWDPTRHHSNTFDRAVCAVMIGLYFSHTTICRYLFNLVRCKGLDEGSYLLADLSIRCDTDVHGAWIFALIAFGVAYVVGIPVLTFGAISRLANLNDPHSRYQLGIYYVGYSPELWFWDAEIIARKVAVTLVASLMAEDPSYAGYVCIWIMQVSLVVHLIANPCKNHRFEKLEMLSQVVNMVTYNVGIMYYNGVSDLTGFFLAALIWVLNLGVWAQFFRSLREELRHESKLAMIRRAKADISKEDEIRRLNVTAELHDLKPALRGLPKRGAEGLRQAFADNSMRDIIATQEVPDLRLKHLQLSLNLENMRNQWRKTKIKGAAGAKRASIEDIARQRQRMLIPAERWRARRREEGAAEVLAEATKAAAQEEEGEDGEPARIGWRDRMADGDWRVQQRMRHRLASDFAGQNAQENGSVVAGSDGGGSGGGEGDIEEAAGPGGES